MRRMLAELGRRLVVAGVIERAEDVYWLRHEELRNQTAVQSGQPGRDLRGQVARRKQIWRGQRRATPPQLLPKGVWFYGMDKMMPAVSEDQTGDVIKGIGASAGQVTAAARVLGGPQDFSQMQPGEVLVASITTPAWTSLFAMASAVVTDIGGPLSHSSIVAREYGIPAVLGTAVATRRISSGERVRVDGDVGTVTLLDQEGAGQAIVPVPTGTRTGVGLPLLDWPREWVLLRWHWRCCAVERVDSNPAEDCDHLAQNRGVVAVNWVVCRVVRQQPDMLAPALERLYGRFIIKQCGNDLAILGGRLLPHHHPVSVADSGLDHRVATYLEQEHGAIADELLW